jgi:hypothetical protein
MFERRKEERLHTSQLPENLKNLSCVAGFFQSYSASAIDMSESGFGFISRDIHIDYLHIGKDVILKFEKYNYKIKSKIVSICHNEHGDYRIGVSFANCEDLQKYRDTLETMKTVESFY